MRHWRLYLIHHSHTDIGYTDYQEKLEMYHVDYIRQVLNILTDIDEGNNPDCEGFKWQCENYWQVENFYKTATEDEKRAFERYLKEGRIGLSGSYLNLTELVDADVLNSRVRKVKAFGENIGAEVTSAMAADINGYAWGTPDVMAENGVLHMFTALHPHHGMFPMNHNPSYFMWEGPKGNKVLMFVGEHYHVGNELGFCPKGNSSYLIYDDVREQMARREILHGSEESTAEEELAIVKTRLTRYLEGLEASGYEPDTIPMMVSGVISDNAPPNALIARRVKEINEMMGDLVTVQMATLDDFFDALKKTGVEIPTVKGDFTDWWADGVGSTPAALKLYREAQRLYHVGNKLDPEGELGDPAYVEDAEQNLIMYAEHTWGYSSSISEPWNTMVASVGMKKSQFAVNANIAAYRNLNQIFAKMGQVTPFPTRVHRARIVNPNDFEVTDRATVILDHWEYIGGNAIDRRQPIVLKNMKTGEILPSQMRSAPRGSAIETTLTLGAHESVDVEVIYGEDPVGTIQHFPKIGADGICDIADQEGMETPFEIDTKYYHVCMSGEKGVASIYDKVHNREIMDLESPYGAFAGIYEVTPSGELDQMSVRRMMGRNRCSLGTKRDVAQLKDARIVETGEVCIILKLSYTLESMLFFDVYLKIYKEIPLLEARVCMHKQGNLDPENLYVAFPFKTDGSNETFIDKTGCILRPGIDQLPGSCQNFYLLQNGIVRLGDNFDVIIAFRDTPLCSFGKREGAPIRLCDCKNTALNTSTPFAWVMNNFWETNFEANLGGVYEFFYTVTTPDHADVKTQFDKCQTMNEGFQVLEI